MITLDLTTVPTEIDGVRNWGGQEKNRENDRNDDAHD